MALGAAAADLPRTLLSIPVVLNGNSPAQITRADLAEVAYTDDDEVDVSLSESATVELLDDPTNDSATATPTTMVSLFQTNSVGLKTTRWLNWEVIRSGAIAWMTVTY